MNVASAPGVVHATNSIMWVSLLMASPGTRSAAVIALVMSVTNGAKSCVVRPGAGRSHAQDTKPEQSERYGSQSGMSGLVHVEAQSTSASGLWFGAWQ